MEQYNPFSLEGRTILVTGASSGIGKETAIECSKLGAKVVVVGRNKKRLEETYDRLSGEGHLIFCMDLVEDSNCDKLVEQIPPLTGVVHAAGIADTTLFQFITAEKLKSVFDINFTAPVLLTKSLLRRKKIQKKSSIVFLSSIDGPVTGHIGNSIYSATKGAVSAIIKNMAVELAKKGIRVNAVLPGQVETPLIHNAGITQEQLEIDKLKYPLGRYATSEEIAWAIIFLLSDASSFSTGTELIIDGGFTLL